MFFKILYSRSLKSPLHSDSYAMRIGGTEILISHTFQHKCYVSVAFIGNLYNIIPFSQQQSQIITP